MPNEATLNVKIHKNDTILKNINEPIHLDSKNWSNYTKCLKTIQKDVNLYLTELVEQEKNAGEQMNVEEEEEDESDEDDDNDSVKRKLETAVYGRKSKKTKYSCT